MVKVYAFKNCDTCRKALKFLAERKIEAKVVPIREQPPKKAELKRMLKRHDGDIRKLFNTSGGDYKAMNLKEKLAALTADEAIQLLAKNGNLVKRPFALAADECAAGFNEEEWKERFTTGA